MPNTTTEMASMHGAHRYRLFDVAAGEYLKGSNGFECPSFETIAVATQAHKEACVGICANSADEIQIHDTAMIAHDGNVGIVPVEPLVELDDLVMQSDSNFHVVKMVNMYRVGNSYDRICVGSSDSDEHYFELPILPDHEVRKIIRIFEKGQQIGYEEGKRDKAAEIRHALGG